MFPKREFEKFPNTYVRMFQLKGVLEFPQQGKIRKRLGSSEQAAIRGRRLLAGQRKSSGEEKNFPRVPEVGGG